MDRRFLWSAALALTAGAAMTWTGYRVRATDKEALAVLTSRLDGLEAIKPGSSKTGESDQVDALGRDLDGLAQRVARLETGSQRAPVSPHVETGVEEMKSPTALEEEQATLDPEQPGDAASHEFEQLLAQLSADGWDFSRSRDDYERFLELARESGFLDEKIDDLEGHIATHPDDVEGRMRLADVYVAKLMTVAGPEQGIWGGRAEEQWGRVVVLDDGNWGAHSALGTNYSYYPEVMGKGLDAIRHLERAREIQRDLAPDPEHVQTYLFLARLYDREGKRDEARAALLEGLEFHYANQKLSSALSRLE